MIVAFDFDGTICDSMGALENLAVDVIGRYWDIADEEVIRQRYRDTAGDPFGVQLPWIVHTINREVVLAEAAYAAEKIAVTMQSKPRRNVILAIEKLWAESIAVHIISSTKTSLIRKWLNEHLGGDMGHLLEYFSCHGIDQGTKVDNLERCRPDYFVGDSATDRARAAALAIKFFHVDEIDDLLAEVLP